MQRSFLPIVGLGLVLAGCSAFPELDAQITDQARGTDYLALQPLERVMATPAPRIAGAEQGEAMMTAGLALQARGGAVASPGLIDTARASQERAERAIAETALARLRLEDEGGGPTLAEAQSLLDRATALLLAAEALQDETPGDAPEIVAGAEPPAAAPAPAAETPGGDPVLALAQEDGATEEIEARIAAILARTAELRDGRIDEQRRLLLERARALSGN